MHSYQRNFPPEGSIHMMHIDGSGHLVSSRCPELPHALLYNYIRNSGPGSLEQIATESRL